MSKANQLVRVIKEITVHTLILLIKSLKWVLILGIVGGIFAFGAGVGYVGALVKDEPIRDKNTIMARMQENTETSFVYFRDGSPIGQIRTEADRRIIELDEIPQVVVDAVLSVEDDNFQNHIGIDLTGLMRALKQRVLNEPVQTGGSTITQQVARNVFLSTAREDSRKAREILLAMRIERFMNKDEIMQAYLNKVPFGNGSSGYNVYGIRAAAEGIFDVKNLNQLHLAQAAYLAGLPQSPSAYSAFSGTGDFNPVGFERAMERQRHVLNRMLVEERITQQQYDEAIRFDVKASLAEKKPKAYSTYPFLMIELERRAAEALVMRDNPQLDQADLKKAEYATLIENAMYELTIGGYEIYTTIDKEMYDKMREIAQNPELFTPDHEEKGVEQIGAIMLDNRTGAILSMMEGRDFNIEQLNHATQMVRQPGSTMKPIAAFLPALESGAIQPGTPIEDVPIVLEDGGARGYHIPQNWNLRYHGLMTVRHAFNQSYNIPPVRLFNETIGIEEAWDFVRRLGITTLTEQDNYARTGVIGGLEYGTTVEELTNAFRTIANKGNFNRAYMISRIEDTDGNIVYEHPLETERVFSEETAYLMTDMMRTVITSGTGTNIMNWFDHYGQIPVVGKTGTSQLDRDAWFIGFSPDITVGVWAGYDQNHTLIQPQRPLAIWSEIMDTAIETRPEWFETEQFEQPDNIVRMTVSSVSGKLPSELARSSGHVVTDLFNREFVPTETGDDLVEMEVVEYNGRNYIPHESTPKDMVAKKTLIKRPVPIYEILDDIAQKLANTPSSQRQLVRGRPATLSDYFPEDLDRTAPVETDPREDNGQTPLAPPAPELTEQEGRYEIRFQESPSENVVGYRLYRSLNGSTFQHRSGQNVLNGQPLVITDYFSSEYDYAYYVTAVDIMGRESAPSTVVYSNRSSRDDFPLPGDENDEDLDDFIDVDPFAPDYDERDVGAPVPAAPENVRAQLQDGGLSVEISWRANANSDRVTHYDVYFSRRADGEYNKIGTTESTAYKYINIPSDGGWFRVVAVNRNGSSTPSDPVRLEMDED